MNKKSKIEFLNNGTEAVIIFPNGGKSIEFTSKKDAFEGIVDMEKQNKITKEEFSEFRDAIFAKNELPWDDGPKGKIRVMHVVGPFMGSSLLDLLMSDAFGEDSEEEEEETCFKMCNEKANHGHIYVKGKGTLNQPIINKVQGIMVVNSLRNDGEINQKSCKKMIKEIENSPLPVDKEFSNKTGTNVN